MIRSLIAAFLGLILTAGMAVGQTSSGKVTTAAPTYVNNTAAPLSLETDGDLRVSLSTGATVSITQPVQVVGNVASGATDSGNPVKVGCVYNSTLPTFTNGQRGDCQIGSRGSLHIELWSNDGNTPVSTTLNPADALSNTAVNATRVQAFPQKFNGVTWDRDFTCPSSAVVNVAAAATTQIVALGASQIIRVCSFTISGDTLATTATFVYGTGANCGTGQVALTGAMRLEDEGDISNSSGNGSLFRTIASNALCLTAATGAVTGFVTYAQY